MKIRVLVVGDHPVVRHGLIAILRYEPRIEMVGDAADGEEAVRLIVEWRPDVVLLDLRLPELSGATMNLANKAYRKRRQQALAEDILSIAQLCLAEHGYAGVSMDALAARCGISKPTLYSLFASKDELVVSAMLQALATIEGLLALQIAQLSALEHLQLVLRWILELQPPGGTLLSHLWFTNLPDQIRAHTLVSAAFERVNRAVLGLVREGIEQGEIASEVDAETIALLFYSFIGALKNVNCYGLDATGSPTVIKTLVMLFTRSVSVRPVLSADAVSMRRCL